MISRELYCRKHLRVDPWETRGKVTVSIATPSHLFTSTLDFCAPSCLSYLLWKMWCKEGKKNAYFKDWGRGENLQLRGSSS